MNFVRIRSVIEKLMPISEMSMAREICKNKKNKNKKIMYVLIWNKSRKHFKSCFCQ